MVATRVKAASYDYAESKSANRNTQIHVPRIANAATLVTGGAVAGLAYEIVSRPWDVARKAVHVDYVLSAHNHHNVVSILRHKVERDGWFSFFRISGAPVHEDFTSPLHRRMQSLLRTIARVGPWGVGFLAWEAFGPGLS